jgi:hypothetical protein
MSRFVEYRNYFRKALDRKPPPGGVLSEGVLAGVEGPSLVVNEFWQFNTSPKSELDPSTTASTPPLSQFRPRQIILARVAVLVLRAGVRGQPPLRLRFLFPEPNQQTNHLAFQPRQNHRTHSTFICGYAALGSSVANSHPSRSCAFVASPFFLPRQKY